jgi:ribosomal protein S18 acetylase RimI-like enzyme
LTARIAERSSSLPGIRPFNPMSDLKPVAELIVVAFGDALDRSSREMLREMRALAWLFGPILWVLGATESHLAHVFGGFVWVEDGEIIGNVTVHRQGADKRGWFISNLAVHPDHRRRGVARSLLLEGVESARARGATRISLEVRAQNTPARKLYQELGFRQVDSITKMEMCPLHTTRPVRSSAYSLEVVSAREDRELYRFAEAVLSAEARETMPVRKRDYRLSLPQRLLSGIGDVLKGRLTYRVVARKEGTLAGFAALRTGGFGFPHSVTLVVHPQHRTHVEEMLLTNALSIVQSGASRALLARIRPSYGHVIDVFEEYGFTEQETLDLFTLELDRE